MTKEDHILDILNNFTNIKGYIFNFSHRVLFKYFLYNKEIFKFDQVHEVINELIVYAIYSRQEKEDFGIYNFKLLFYLINLELFLSTPNKEAIILDDASESDFLYSLKNRKFFGQPYKPIEINSAFYIKDENFLSEDDVLLKLSAFNFINEFFSYMINCYCKFYKAPDSILHNYFYIILEYYVERFLASDLYLESSITLNKDLSQLNSLVKSYSLDCSFRSKLIKLIYFYGLSKQAAEAILYYGILDGDFALISHVIAFYPTIKISKLPNIEKNLCEEEDETKKQELIYKINASIELLVTSGILAIESLDSSITNFKQLDIKYLNKEKHQFFNQTTLGLKEEDYLKNIKLENNYIARTSADGNCFFEAVHISLRQEHLSRFGYTPNQLRLFVIEELRTNSIFRDIFTETTFQEYIESHSRINPLQSTNINEHYFSEFNDGIFTFDRYLEYISRNGSWADHYAIQALSNVLDVQINIFEINRLTPIIFSPETQSPPSHTNIINIFYENENHFRPIISTEALIPSIEDILPSALETSSESNHLFNNESISEENNLYQNYLGLFELFYQDENSSY